MKWIKCSFIHQTKMWPFNHLRKKNFHLLPKVPHLPSLSALRRRGDPIPLRSALPGRSHPSPLYGIGTIPPLSAMRCRGETILLRFAVSGWDYPFPLYGVRTIPSLSAMRRRGETILLRFAVSGRSHPSPLYGAGSIPSLSALWCRGDPIPLRCALPGRSHSSSLYHDNEIDGGQKMCGLCAKSYKRNAIERQGIYQLLISIICNDMIMKWIKRSFIHQTKMWPFNHLRKKNFHLLPKVPHLPSLSALRCRGDPIPLRSALPRRSHPSPLYGIGTIPLLSAMRCRG